MTATSNKYYYERVPWYTVPIFMLFIALLVWHPKFLSFSGEFFLVVGTVVSIVWLWKALSTPMLTITPTHISIRGVMRAFGTGGKMYTIGVEKIARIEFGMQDFPLRKTPLETLYIKTTEGTSLPLRMMKEFRKKDREELRGYINELQKAIDQKVLVSESHHS
jgi:hypothetical protein